MKKSITLKKFLLPIVVTLGAAASQWIFWSWISPDRFILLYPAVFFSAWYGGFAVGLLATVCSVLIVDFLFIPPLMELGVTPHESVHLVVFFVIGGVLSYLIGRFTSRQSVLETQALGEAQLKLITGAVPALISYLDLNERYVFTNATWDKWFGPPRSQVIGKTLREVIGDEAYTNVGEHLKKALKGEVVQYETRFKMPNGSTPFIKVTYVPDVAGDGSVRGVVALVTDVTDLKKAEIARNESQSRFQTVVEQSPFAFQIYDRTGLTIYANPAWERLWETKRSELDGYNILKDPHAQEPGVLALMLRAFAGEAVTFPDVFYDPAKNGKNGRTRWIRTHLFPIKGMDGELVEVVQVLEDITDSKNLLVAAENQHHWLEAVLNLMPTPLMLIEPATGEVKFSNRAADQIAGGITPKSTPSSQYDTTYRITDERNQSIPNEELPAARAARGEKVDGQEIVWHTSAGRFSLVTYSEMLPEMFDHPGMAELTGLDITRLKETERALHEAVRSRDEFLSIASHELRTPITGLVLQTQVRQRHLENGNMAAFTAERLQKMFGVDLSQLDRLTRLVEDMLDISRISTGKLTMEPEEFDLCDLTREVTESILPQFLAVGSLISIDCAVSSVHGKWDRYRIEQVVMNLLTNALRYGSGQPVRISVGTEGREAILSVQDHGIGIAPEDQQRIFGRFERAISVNEISGLGLGLYIVRQILDAHGGSISVKSELGKGSTFTIRLPLPASGDAIKE